MDLITITLLSLVFLFAVSLVELVYHLWVESHFARKKIFRKRLMYISAGGKHGKDKLDRFRERTLQNAAYIEKLAQSLPRSTRLDQMLLKSGLPISASGFIICCCILAILGLGIGIFVKRPDLAFMLAIMGLLLPYIFLRTKEGQFMRKFEEQLPEALDLLARAMRSGHALTSGLEMVAQEMDDPIKSEFGATVDEINLGLSFKEAFGNLCERVPSTDLAFFAIATLIQKETGGNIAEILDKISKLIRERIQFKRELKTLTAEGRLSAWILIALPILMFIYIYFANYEYVSLLWRDKAGHYMLSGGILLQIIGVFAINKIIKIEI
ncbi:MAG: type II secretion system F family protein [Desulfobulbaceae bacterium]|nr:type II secretion system F family protein [Desulfobulbaceae bacterium]